MSDVDVETAIAEDPIVAAIDERIRQHQGALDALARLRQGAAAVVGGLAGLNGGTPALEIEDATGGDPAKFRVDEPPPAGDPDTVDVGESSEPDAVPPADEAPPARRSSPRKGERAKAIEAGQAAVLEAVRDAGTDGIKAPAIADETGVHPNTVRKYLKKLSRGSPAGPAAISVEDLGGGPTGGKLYRAAEAEAAPADVDGARTDPERRIVEYLRGCDGPRPTSDVSVQCRIPVPDAASMLNALATRGVLRRLEPKRDHLPPRWEMAGRTALR